jgi:tRNA (guanine37-N1)-methyltransferase
MPRESFCIRVPKIHGEKTIALTNRLGLADRELEIQKDESHIYVPFVRQPSEQEKSELTKQTSDMLFEVRVFQERKRPEKNLAELLENQLPPHLLTSLPKALDIIGDIAVIEVPPELKTYETLLGEAILKRYRNVRTVLAKAGAISGTYRLRQFNVIAGEPRTTTVHKEFGCAYNVDVAKAYFSPRLSHEHKRVASLVQEGETVVDLFAGVGPFSILIAKTVEDAKVYAVDINPEAVELLKKNVGLNRVQNRVIPILGDAKQIVQDRLLGAADRVIMNLPESAFEFVNVACRAVKPAGGVVHFYGFVRRPDTLEAMQVRFSEAVQKTGRKVERSLSARAVRETAPYEWQIVLDAKIT